MTLKTSELILNSDGSIYHLHLQPSDIATTIITVGDISRVKEVSKHFDTIELRKGNREFLTHTGVLNGFRLTVISTGIGTDNIDIVLNELDALVNIDFETRVIKKQHTQLTIIRLGTSGALQANIPVDSFLISKAAIGLDGLLHYYKHNGINNVDIENAFISQTKYPTTHAKPYAIDCSKSLEEQFLDTNLPLGLTITNTGFYGPQSRILRVPLQDDALLLKMIAFDYNSQRITNLEMETSGIYGLSKLLGHRSISLNCILANRAIGTFSKNPKKAIASLITLALQKITQ